MPRPTRKPPDLSITKLTAYRYCDQCRADTPFPVWEVKQAGKVDQWHYLCDTHAVLLVERVGAK